MKKTQWVAVSISFVLAVTLWLLVTLNTQTYTTDFRMPLKLVNFPNNLQLTSEFPNELQVFANGPGIKLLYQSFNPVTDTLEIDFDLFRRTGYFNSDKNLKLISGILQPGLSAVAAKPDTISLAYAVKANKKVAVTLDVKFDLPPSYRVPASNLKYTDSVLLIGPEDSIAKVAAVRTVPIQLPPSVEAQSASIPLQRMGTFQMQPDQISLSFTPLHYTEKTVQIPLRTLSVPIGARLRLEPDTLQIKVLVPVEQFEQVNAQNILATVDFKEIDSRSPYLIPKIGNLPPEGELVGFAPQLIRYWIITRE